MSQDNPFGKTYTVARFNPGPQTLGPVGPGNSTGKPKSKKKKRRRKKKKKDTAVQQYLDFLSD